MGCAHSIRRCSPFEDKALPMEVVQRITSFLLGIDLFQYAQASPPWRALLETPEIWAGRVERRLLLPDASVQSQASTTPWCCPPKVIYFQQRSLQFSGTNGGGSWMFSPPRPRRGDFIGLPHMLIVRMGQCALELTFSVSPISPGSSTCQSSVLLGFQGNHCTDPLDPFSSIALVAVDSSGGLLITIEEATHTPRAVAQLTFDRWYHLLVVFAEHDVLAYLDGELAFSEPTPPPSLLYFPLYGQIGTGFRHEPLQAIHRDEPTGWRPFHGLVADARVLGAELSAEDARRHARGECMGTPGRVRDLIRDTDEIPDVKRVVTSRPCERYAQMLPRR